MPLCLLEVETLCDGADSDSDVIRELVANGKKGMFVN